MNIPWGKWHPDASGINTKTLVEAKNCLPSVQGFRPLPSPTTVSQALTAVCQGAVTVLLEDGSNESFAGDATKLYKLANDYSWEDVTRASGGAYATPSGERWRFAMFGTTVIATNFNDTPQKYTIGSSTDFAVLGGSPPKARYIDIVRDFVVLGSLDAAETSIHWSAINNAEGWTAGTASSDTQTFPSGGPVRGIIGGETGYIFQADSVTRMTFAPGSSAIFQFDEVEGGRGLAAPNSLVRLAREAFYFGGDGFYRFDLGGGASQPIGVGKWAEFFLADLRSGTEISILSGVSPGQRVVMWPYISRNNGTSTCDKILIYDWALDEACFAQINVEAVAPWLTSGVTLDTMNSFGTLDELPFSLDSPFWKGGTKLLGLFGTDHKLAHLDGTNMAARFITADGMGSGRSLIKGTRPFIDATGTTVAIAARERDGDAITFSADESMEDTGVCPAWVSGNIARARITVPAAADWSYAKGIETITGPRGKR